jgi:hypothetical protein
MAQIPDQLPPIMGKETKNLGFNADLKQFKEEKMDLTRTAVILLLPVLSLLIYTISARLIKQMLDSS